MIESVPTAAILAIGNEILRGSTKDTNTAYLIERLVKRGVAVKRCLVIADELDVIAREIADLSGRFDLVFVSGGIGPTPDDLTRPAVAQGLGLELALNEVALAEYERVKGTPLNPGQREMCRLPEGCELIWPEFPSPPAFKAKNVYVMPGVPQILHSIWQVIEERFNGPQMHCAAFSTFKGESRWAHIMAEFIARYPEISFGSYPKMEDPWRVELHLSGPDKAQVEEAAADLEQAIGDVE